MEMEAEKLLDLTGIEKLKYVSYLFSFSGKFPEIEDNSKYEEMAEAKIKFDREIDKIRNSFQGFSDLLFSMVRKGYPSLMAGKIVGFDPLLSNKEKEDKSTDQSMKLIDKWINFLS